jgi:superfamily II DNA or RNA helicase
MTKAQGELFIVDNSDEHWKALEYLRQWCEISSAIDIATGHFEIGALLALDGEWQKCDKIRILIGGETSGTTAAAVAAALDESFAAERATGDPFLTGIESVVEAIHDGRIEIRVYRMKKFHAKAYITHGRLEVVGSAALVGSSNFTRPGLTRNVELNVRFNGPEVRELQDWYEAHWQEAEPVTEELLTILQRNTRQFTPYEIYAKALQAITADVEPGEQEWERHSSAIYPLLAPYQREAYHGLRRMADRWRGGLLTDGVGLGKTFVGLMLTEYYAVKQRKNVLILATKTGQDAVWEPEIAARLPELAGGEFSNVRVMAHTDLSRADAPELVARLKDRVDIIIIDEGHNFRNHGKKGDDIETRRSRWWRLQEIAQGKIVFLLTATPINNSLFDLVHQVEMFSGLDDSYFSSVGVTSLQRYVANLEKPFRDAAKKQNIVTTGLDLTDFERLLQRDQWLESIIWQNSRKYAVESAKLAGADDVLFPTMDDPQVVDYQLLLQHDRLLLELEQAFAKHNPLFTLPMYYPLGYSLSKDVDTKAENRQRQVVGLIRTVFLKRFESSVAAFAGSCLDLTAKILVWLDANVTGDAAAVARLAQWRQLNDGLLDKVHELYRPTLEMQALELSDDLTEEELEELEINLDPGEYDIPAMVDAAFEDLHQLQKFLDRIVDVAISGDDKYQRLRDLLLGVRGKGEQLDPLVFTEEFRQQKVLIFTEFADTARYLHQRLEADGLADVDRLDGTRKADRYSMIRRFAPFYNKVPAAEMTALKPLRVLVSTDVLSEGVNLQDASLVVNYDLHWNPVRLMQRIGRVDRRMDAAIEAALVKAHPKTKKSRGRVQIRNFLPPDALERLLKLHQRVETKVLMISKTLGIPGGKLLTPDDIHDDVKVLQAFREEYEGDLSPIEVLRLQYLEMLAHDPGLEERIAQLPRGAATAKAGEPAGVFACRAFPTLERRTDEPDAEVWTMEHPRIRWVLQAVGGSTVLDPLAIDSAIRSDQQTVAASFGDRQQVARALRGLEAETTREHRKETQAPLDAPLPSTICWMETR